MLLSVVCASHGKPRLPNFLPTEKFAYRQLPQYIGFQQTSDVIACIDGQSIKYLPVVMYFCQLKHHIANYVMHVSNVVEIIVKVNWKSFVTRHSKWFWYDFFDSVVFLGVENQEAEPGARLTCHLLLRLLDESTDVMSHDHSSALKFPFKSSHDHHLLSAAHDSIRIGPVLAALKAMLKLSEAGMLYCSRSSSVCSFCSRFSVIVHVNERNSECAMLCFHDKLFFRVHALSFVFTERNHGRKSQLEYY